VGDLLRLEDIVEFGRLKPPLLLACSADFLMQFIRRVTAEDPVGVPDMAVKIASAGRGGGYTLDSMAQQGPTSLAPSARRIHLPGHAATSRIITYVVCSARP